MTGKRQKIIILISMLLALIVLFVILVLFSGSLSSAMWTIYSFIITLAVFSVGTAVYLNHALKKKVSSLPKEYQDVYFNAQDLVILSTKSWKARKEVHRIILEVFEHAALDQRDVNEVINNDLETFVKEYLVDQPDTFNLRYILLYSTSLYLFFILLMKLYKVLRADSISIDNFKTETLDVGITLTYLIIAYVFYPLLMYSVHFIAKKQWNDYKRFIVLIPMLIPILLMFGLIFIENESLRTFLDTEIALFSNIYAFLFGVVLFIVCMVLTATSGI